MAKIKITCDSTCDLSTELMEKYGITPLSLYVRFGDDTYKDGENIDAMKLFSLVKQSGKLPKTAAVSVSDYIDAWKPYIDDGYEIVHINISHLMSSCYQNAVIAAENLGGRIYPVDSLNLSTGSGHLAIQAAELAKEGNNASEIAEKLAASAYKLEVSFVVDTLEYLHKGGRCSSIAKLGANLLKLRPCIEVHSGEMSVAKKYRGTMEKALTDYVKDRLEGRDDLNLKRIFITHTHAPAEIVKHVRNEIKRYQPFAEILETFAGCTVTSHCGQGTLGILFFTE